MSPTRDAIANPREPNLSLGLDIGSIALKLVVMRNDVELLDSVYVRTFGRPVETAINALEPLLKRYPADRFDLIAGTGSAGKLVCQLLGAAFVNEVVCQATAIRHLHPEVRTLIEMGGQDSKLIFLAESPDAIDGQAMVDFSMNTNCAAGTGSFLDQQASRLGIRIEDEFGGLALRCKTPPRVAGRCSVFAKSDMIHLQQQAAPVEDIVAGLCLGLARNLKSNLGRGMDLPKPIAFCGGVAANRGVVRAIEEVFGLGPGELVVPEWHALTGALGAILTQRLHGENTPDTRTRLDLKALRRHLERASTIGHRLSPLEQPAHGHAVAVPSREELLSRVNGQRIPAWLGLDVGSISTKAAVVDQDNRVLGKIYLMTAGRPLDAVRRVLDELNRQVGGLVEIRGAATTGSGRYLTGDVVGADLVINEITAQATAAAAIDPQVDTIFEIGGQDSKFICLDRGVVVDFEMNHACAAGTGSFLEEQAERLGVRIKDQFADLALRSRAPIRLGERCTVFMESDVIGYQQQGADTADLAAGLCYSIVNNYINRVVGRRKIGGRIFFQGGTAFNRGVVAAFEKVTGRPITVPAHHEVTGAIGAGILARRFQLEHGNPASRFRGFDAANMQYSLRSFECDGCSNHCEINEVTLPGRPALYYGSRCDRYNRRADEGAGQKLPDLFVQRHRLLLKHAGLSAHRKPERPTVGIPLALSNYELLPFWATLLRDLDCNVVVSRKSDQQVIRRGVEAVLATPCFPVKVAHGHVLELIDKGVDFLWLPSIVAMNRDSKQNPFNQLCPYVTAIPYQIQALPAAAKITLLKPAVRFDGGIRGLCHSLRGLRTALGVSSRRIARAARRALQAQGAFETACRERGREVLSSLQSADRAVVVVSRPYNGCDTAVSLDLPAKLRKLGVLAIPLDFLELPAPSICNDRLSLNMYWKYGQRVLRAADFIRGDPRLHAIYLTNFGCGPDSFLVSYFKRAMSPKPSLVLEIDEHSADGGVVTRLEAFLESVHNAPAARSTRSLPLYPAVPTSAQGRTLFLPWMGDSAYAVAAAMRGVGQPAQVIPIADERSVEAGRRVCTGKECLPCIITAGDMLRLAAQPGFDPQRSAFFMPGGSGPCRLGQYNCLHRFILDDAGLKNVPVIAVSQDKEFYDQWQSLHPGIDRLAWAGICAVDALYRALLHVRPCEISPGQTDALYQLHLQRICDLLESRATDKALAGELATAAAAMARVPVARRAKPRIGVVGEIYVRHHDFANNDLVRTLERLGAQVVCATFPEWIYYTNWSRMHEAAHDFSYRQFISNWFRDAVQRRIHRRFDAPFRRLLGLPDEPRTRELLAAAAPYVHHSFWGGDTLLSIGKCVEFRRAGCDGVINVMPFGCMPSTIVAALTRRVSADLGEMPILNVSCDGQQDPQLQTRLEAFIHQARARSADSPTRARHGSSGRVPVG